MGEKLVNFYKEAQQIGRLKAKMRLAMMTKIPSAKASTVPDSAENINKFKKAMAEIKKEFK